MTEQVIAAAPPPPAAPPIDPGAPPPAAPATPPATPPTPAPLAAPVPNAPPSPEPAPYWPNDWREKIAEHTSAGDKKIYEKELRRLQNMESPYSVYGSFRGLENTWASRNFIKLPPKENASEADIKEFHKNLGVPENPADYLKDVKLANGLVLGEADKPVAEAFAAVAHKAGIPPAGYNEALNWYLQTQEKQAAELDERDERYRIDSERALKEEFGPSYKRKTNAIATLFDLAAGGADIKNEKALYSRLMGGRMADGTLIGNDPDMVKFLVALAMDRNPAASVVEDGDQTGTSINDEIAKIEKIMREDRPLYNKQYAGRYAELLAARQKIQSRQRA